MHFHRVLTGDRSCDLLWDISAFLFVVLGFRFVVFGSSSPGSKCVKGGSLILPRKATIRGRKYTLHSSWAWCPTLALAAPAPETLRCLQDRLGPFNERSHRAASG